MKKLLFLLVLIGCINSSDAQSKKQRKAAIEAEQRAQQLLLLQLRAHVAFLSDDKLEGRSTGSEGERLAMEYISNQFKSIGLQPKGTQGYVQAFVVEEGKKVDAATRLSINDNLLQLNKEYIPLAYSATTAVSGMPSIALRERGVPWFLDVKSWLEANKNNPHYNIDEAIRTEAAKFAAKGATALFVYNSGNAVDNIRFNGKENAAAATIPIVYITADGYKKYLKDPSAMLDIEMQVAFNQRDRKGHNVLGYIDNSAPSTVVIGAHYDHLGWGEDGGGLDTGRIVHNGADDNASGTAAMIEIARLLAQSKLKANNYLFIAFSGEELGLIGSKYWLDNRTINTPINYMVNLDMVGRYDSDKKLSIGGVGTSPAWSELLAGIADNTLAIKFDSTGSGPSDHAAFYRKNIPVLFFFTGTHTDYHRSSDDADKVNYDGQAKVVRYIHKLVEASQAKGQLAFQKTAEPQVAAIKYSVSLGVIPDYSYAQGGLKIDGVSPKKLASKLGLQAGDVLTYLGAYKIDDIQTYMQALAGFKNGDKTTLRIKRGKEEKEFAVEF
ncbi:M20/M25/M40 family metallo-hydrolase [Aridibaculum aurantiacum]|uniref:M20/M25/M40 family metallo-hydrolase n=1 Tax=Aridibaculum aurantiacum TaxID=2810307 RepID=UPI001A96B500|nr:M20/M25/M40 family metallo-hydrolase [Aridibaculum aurantiacum]